MSLTKRAMAMAIEARNVAWKRAVAAQAEVIAANRAYEEADRTVQLMFRGQGKDEVLSDFEEV